MAWPNTLKTVFVLDHGPLMARPSDMPMELDVFNKSRSHPGSFIPVPPVSKSLWTCAAEATFEYCRIVWDIYPTGRLIRLMISDVKSHPIGSWATNVQSLSNITYNFAHHGPPIPDSRHGECSIMHGLSAALEAISECTEAQLERLASSNDAKSKVMNRGRVICMSSFREDGYVRSLESYFQETLLQINQRNFPPTHMPIHHCDLVLINVYPNQSNPTIKEHPRLELSPLLSCELISVCASRWLASRLVSLVLQHYELASTTVTGIPMKEEQNASSSANYDVEIFHPAAAHADILKLKNESALFLMKEGYGYKTVTLKWCTPRATSNSVEMWPCSSAHRISPVDVTSRPSSCLTNFLLGGRSVMLELPRSGAGTRTTSHMLAAHGGEIFLHSLLIGRSVIEDPPSISEGSGGRVTDYRIPDFGELMKENKLVPYIDHSGSSPLESAKSRMERYTQYWPLTISSTILYNMGSHVEALTKLMVLEELTDDQVIDCKKVIYNLLAMESRNESLPPACSGHRDRGNKGNKREEQYRILFKECEIMLRHHSRTEQHKRVLACLLECRTKGGLPAAIIIPPSIKETPMEALSGPVSRPAIPDTPLSPVPVKAPRLDLRGSVSVMPGKSLLEMWTTNVSADVAKKQREFVGRTKAGPGIAKLYTTQIDKEQQHE